MFGFGKGSIEIQLEKYNFSPGETISGNVSLKVKKQEKAKAVTIRLIGEQKTSNFSTVQKTSTQTRKQYIYDFKQQLDKEKEYSGEYNYNFQIKIPQNILNSINSTLSAVMNSMQILTGQSSQIRWYLIASLEIPWAIDISKKVQINIA